MRSSTIKKIDKTNIFVVTYQELKNMNKKDHILIEIRKSFCFVSMYNFFIVSVLYILP